MKKIAEAEFTLTEAAQIFQTATPPAGTTREDVLDPVFWAHVAKNLRPMSEIRIMPKDGAWYGVYLCLYADRTQAKIVELSYHPMSSIKEEVTASGYEVKWISPPVKWGVIRLADKENVKDGFPTKEEAQKWLANYQKSQLVA